MYCSLLVQASSSVISRLFVKVAQTSTSRIGAQSGFNKQSPFSAATSTVSVLLQRSIHLSSLNLSPFAVASNMSAAVKPKVVFVLGAPGAGKGTQCSKIVDEFGFVHLSAGDLLREERQRPGSEMGELIENYITNGKIVPVEVTCSLLEKAMNKSIVANSKKSTFLIDGFPRNKDNLDGWERQMIDKADLQFVLVFDCTEDVCVDRCLTRGAAGSGRTDDNLESLKKRFNTFYTDSLPIIEHYNSQNLVRKIDGGPAADLVFEKVKAVFNQVSGSSEKA